jgi:hypothetical protein
MSSNPNSQQQTHLGSFASTSESSSATTSKTGDTADSTSRQPPEPKPASLPHGDLPDVCEWHDELQTIHGVTVAVPAAENSIDRPGGGIIRTRNVAYVVDRDELETYRDEYGQAEIEVPKYYSRLAEYDPVITAQTAASRKGGYGIGSSRLRDALRLMAGTGRFTHSAVTITACGRRHFIAEYQTDDTDVAYLFQPSKIAPTAGQLLDAAAPITEHTVDGITLPDDHPNMGEAFRSFKTAFETIYDESLTRHVKRDGKFHYFETADGTHYKIACGDILNTKAARPITDCLGDRTIETDFGESLTTTWDEPHYEFGDSPWPNRTEPAVIGATLRYSDPRTSSIISLSHSLTAYATYLYLERSPQAPEHKDIVTVDVDLKDERIDSFDVEQTQSPPSPL